jgi:hypothetical protein
MANKTNKEIVRRLLRGDELSLCYADGTPMISYIGFNGKSPLSVSHSLSNFLIGSEFVDHSGDNDYPIGEPRVEYYRATEKLEQEFKNMNFYSLGDTVEYNHISSMSNKIVKKKGVITKVHDPLALGVNIDGVSNIKYTVSTSVFGITRKVLLEKTIKSSKHSFIPNDKEEGVVYDYDDDYFIPGVVFDYDDDYFIPDDEWWNDAVW